MNRLLACIAALAFSHIAFAAVGTDTLATLTFPGSNGAALPAGIAGGYGTWTQDGSSGLTYASGLSGGKYTLSDPARANDNYSIAFTGLVIGSSYAGVIGRISSSGATVNGYYVGDDNSGGIQISKITAGELGAALAQSSSVGTGATEWLSAATISFDSDGSGGCVITATSTHNATVLTYTDVAANSPYLSGGVGLFSIATGTPTVYVGPITIKGTANATGALLLRRRRN